MSTGRYDTLNQRLRIVRFRHAGSRVRLLLHRVEVQIGAQPIKDPRQLIKQDRR